MEGNYPISFCSCLKLKLRKVDTIAPKVDHHGGQFVTFGGQPATSVQLYHIIVIVPCQVLSVLLL